MFNSGINAFLSKPLNIGKLYTALSIYLSDTSTAVSKVKAIESEEEITYAGLNIEEGIKHASNSEALYIEVLKEFSTAYGTSDEIFVKLIHEHRYEQVKMLCVDMRGLTGTIGAEKMHTLVTEILQQLLYKKYDMLVNFKEKYVFEIKTLKRSIDKYISAS
jgi:citrate synthase